MVVPAWPAAVAQGDFSKFGAVSVPLSRIKKSPVSTCIATGMIPHVTNHDRCITDLRPSASRSTRENEKSGVR